MRTGVLLSVVAGVALSAHGAMAQCGEAFDFADFSSVTDLNLVSQASVVDDRLHLTRTGLGGEGAAWYAASKATFDGGFRTSFRFAIQNGTADGFAFVIQDDANDTVGSGGSGLGYAGIPRSVAIEFDTFIFSDEFQGMHVSVQTDRLNGNSEADAFSLAHAFLPDSVTDGEFHDVKIEYTPGVLYVWFDGEPILFCPLDLLTLDIGSPLFSDCAWVGFTAGAGGATADQVIESWSFTDWSDVLECVGPTPDGFDGPGFTPQTGDRVTFRSVVNGTGPLTYVWRKEDIDLNDDARILGSRSEFMIIDPFIPADAGAYQFGAGNRCAGYGIGSIEIAIQCPGDLNGDGLVDDSDFLEFLPSYDALLVPEADKRCDWNGDRLVDDADFLLFLPYYDQLICP